jgi:hypothetical protein
MITKDYYRILEVPPLSSPSEIKKGFRILARRFHPDNNPNDPTATAHFQEIQEAYEVLSNPKKRIQYDFSLKKSSNYIDFSRNEMITPLEILNQTQHLVDYLKKIHLRAINSDALADYILTLLNDQNIKSLVRENNLLLNSQIVQHLLISSKSIISTRLFFLIFDQMKQLHVSESIVQKLEEEMHWRLKKEQQNRLVPLLTIAIVVFIIVLMYFFL